MSNLLLKKLQLKKPAEQEVKSEETPEPEEKKEEAPEVEEPKAEEVSTEAAEDKTDDNKEEPKE